ncbi:MAG: molybdopterin-dependent oxidoreductase [Kutzneria sp.]|nr:molybdopterin-dependent oxidoreductase [Kutzneria sp.]
MSRSASSSRGQDEPTTAPLPRCVAALVGILAVAAALAAGHLVAGFVDPAASPFLAVGDSAIDLTPPPLKDFAVRAFGTTDKVVLLIGMGAVLTLAAVAAGLLSRRSPVPGTVLAVMLGLLGVAAVYSRGNLSQLTVLAPAASLSIGVAVFRWLHTVASRRARRLSGPCAAAGGMGPAGTDRRRFLVTSAGVAIGSGLAGLGGQLAAGRVDVEASRAKVTTMVARHPRPAVPSGADFAGQGTPTFLTPNRDFYRIDTALSVPRLRAEDWSLRVHGMVDRELRLTFDDIATMPLQVRTITMACVSNEVGGPYISTADFVGVPLRELLARAGVRSGADQVFSTSVDGYTAGSPVAETLDPGRDAMLAIGMNGEALPAEHGFPARLVVPGLYGYVSATKWVTDIELTTFADKRSYWVPRGYSAKAPIKTESRIDSPQGLTTIKAGRLTVAGIAWAPTKGISKVELRMDGGPWQPADLGIEVSGQAWRMWRKEYDLAPGSHTVVSRATDGSGYTQTADQVGPIPDGATGLHTIVFTMT